MAEISLTAEKRTISTKGYLNQLRKSGRVPGVFYLKDSEPINFSVEEIEVNPLIFTSETHIINLELSGKEKYPSVFKDVQFDPVSDRVIHFDLMGVTVGQVLNLEIPVTLVGQSIGEKSGGVVDQVLYRLDIECLPRNIPEQIVVDISDLDIGDSISVSEISVENIEILNPENSIIVSIDRPRSAEEVEEVDQETEELEEPEIIGKGKQEEEESVESE